MKDITGYEGLYAVTSCGKVWSYRSQKFLKLQDNGNGYTIVGLCKNGKNKTFLVHRLVGLAYITNTNPTEFTEINHIDEIKNHNYVKNLEWCSFDYNQHYGTRNVRIQDLKEKHAVKQFSLDGILLACYASLSDANRSTNIAKSSIARCCKGERKSAGGYHWQYV